MVKQQQWLKCIEDADENVMHLAKQYLAFDFVEEVHVKEEKQKLSVKGKVVIFENKYKLDFTCDKAYNLIDMECDCDADDELCAHVVAVCMHLAAQDVHIFPYDFVSNKSEAFVERVKIQEKRVMKELQDALLAKGRSLLDKRRQDFLVELQTIQETTRYQLETTFSLSDGTINIGYRVGLPDRMYVVQNIQSFLNLIEKKEYHSYGKKLAFRHVFDNFDEYAQKHIEWMERYIVDESLRRLKEYSDLDYHYYEIDRRNVHVEPRNLDDFYDMFKDCENPYLVCQDKEQHLKIKIEKQDDLYVFSLKTDTSIQVSKKHAYQSYVKQKTLYLYRYILDDQNIVQEFLHHFHQDGNFYVHEDEYEEFYRYVLSDVIAYIDIEGDVPQELEDPCQKIELYVDQVRNDIVLQLSYRYQDERREDGFCEGARLDRKQLLVENYINNIAHQLDFKRHIACISLSEEDSLEVLNETIEQISAYADVYVSDALNKIRRKTPYKMQVGIKVKNNLLDLQLTSEDIPKDELLAVLQAYRRKKKFHRLKNGQIIGLENATLQEMDQWLEQLHITKKDALQTHMQIPLYRMFAIEEGDNQYLHIERSASYQEQLQRFEKKDWMDIPLPKAFASTLREYQKDGYRWLKLLQHYGFHGILADDMGLGKTLQVIALLASEKTKKPSIVVCPSSLIYNWEEEFKKFSPKTKVKCIVGKQTQRKKDIEECQEYDVYVTSYDYLRRDIAWYENLSFYYVILDEAQYIKNQKTKNAVCVKALQSDYRLALSGTPIENSLAELWSIFDFLMPNYLYSYAYFQKEYEIPIVVHQDKEKEARLQKLVGPFILRRTKKEVLKELPEKVETTQWIDFNEEEEKLYQANILQFQKHMHDLTQQDGTNKIEVLAMLTKLRQICCEPRLVYENVNTVSSKFQACMEWIVNIQENHQKVLIFSGFTSMLDLLQEECRKRNIKSYLLNGTTTKEKRKEMVEQFQEDDTPVFFISLKAGGTGLNLTAAQYVIHIDPWWNQSAQDQASDRAYRMGQQNTVQVIRLVMRNSIEEKIQHMQKRKQALANTFVEESVGSLSTMDMKELMDLFSL